MVSRSPFHLTPLRATGLVAGGLALLLAIALPGPLISVPLAPAVVNLALVAGLLSLLLVLFEGSSRRAQDRLLVLAGPYLAAGVLARLLYMDPGTSQAVVLRATAVPEAVSMGLAIVLAWAWGRSRRGVLAVGAGGSVAALALLGVHVGRARPVGDGQGWLLVATGAVVLAALAVQWAIARQLDGPRWQALAGGPALVIASGQLLDGVVSYLAVRDPLGLLPHALSEDVLLSGLVLETAGPVFPLLKWGLALGAVALVEPGTSSGTWWQRVGVLVLVLFVGLGPGLFSSLQVLYL